MSYNNYLSPPGINKSKNTNIKDFCCHQNIFPRNLPKRYVKIKILYLSTNNQSQLFNIYVIHTLVFYETGRFQRITFTYKLKKSQCVIRKMFLETTTNATSRRAKTHIKTFKAHMSSKLHVCSVNTVHTG